MQSRSVVELRGLRIDDEAPAMVDITVQPVVQPKALGVTVPGMPIGSPGMEVPGGKTEAYETLLLLDAKGRTKVFARHG